MHLTVDASPLLTPHTGIGVYTREILSEMINASPQMRIDAFFGMKWAQLDHRHPLLSKSPKGHGGLQALRKIVQPLPGARYSWNLLKKNRFESGIGKTDYDIFWQPCFIPPGNAERSVVTVHDLSHIEFPEFHPVSRLKWLDGLGHALQKAEQVIAISHFTKNEIHKHFDIAPNKINVIPNGVSSRFMPATNEDIETTTKRYGLAAGNFFLSISTLEPRKNLSTLIEAYNNLPAPVKDTTPLVLVGPKGWGRDAEVGYFESLCKGGRLVMTGYIPESELIALVSSATAFAYPSHYEGFGLPAIEAMSCGAVTLLSDAPALLEVSGGTAIHVPARDIGKWTDALKRAHGTTESERERFRSAAMVQASQYSWSTAAHKTLELLTQVSARKSAHP